MSAEAAREAIYKAVVEVCTSASEYGGSTHSQMVRDAAHAFRAAMGGPQPGSSVTEKG